MDSRPKALAAAVLAASFILPFFVADSSDARSSSRRNYSAEWESERRQEEREDRHAKRQERYYDHKERQLDAVLDTIGGRGGGGGSSANGGQSCMYGAGGKVIHRPAGAVCKGDTPASQAASSSATPANAPKKETKGRCVYGKSGKVLWSAPGAEC